MTTDHRQHLGRLGERLAAEHFARLGYAVLARNHRTRCGELDLVARRRRARSCSARSRRAALGSGEPFESLHGAKRAQVRRMAAAWLTEPSDRPLARRSCASTRSASSSTPRTGSSRLDHLEGAF